MRKLVLTGREQLPPQHDWPALRHEPGPRGESCARCTNWPRTASNCGCCPCR
ncbi:hypothetical protein O1L55_09685 [Streptomyces albulus]|nr:hypothetical protein [Streptomyces noursei]